jgi:hypothetical protein
LRKRQAKLALELRVGRRRLVLLKARAANHSRFQPQEAAFATAASLFFRQTNISQSHLISLRSMLIAAAYANLARARRQTTAQMSLTPHP